MTVNLNITKDQEIALRKAWGEGLDEAAFAALVIEGYRSGKYGSATVRRLLNHESRWETERWLIERGVPLNYTLEDLEADRRTMDKLFGKSA